MNAFQVHHITGRVSSIALFTILTALLVHGTADAVGELPEGWIRAGSAPADYDMGTDRANVQAGKASGYLKSNTATPGGFGTLMQMCRADEFHDKRVRMSGWVKSEKVAKWAGLWMRVDGSDAKHMLAFDNMQSRPIKGTSEWQKYQIVLDVAAEAKDIAFGVLLDGPGSVWIDGVRFEIVDRSVPTTGTGGVGDMALKPRNLDFED